MKETIKTIMKWHKETFPDATLEGQINKYAEETNEFMNTVPRKDLLELADMVIVCAGIMRFARSLGSCFLQNTYVICSEIGEYDMMELWDAVQHKMEKNRKRVWNKTGDGNYHHENGIED
jgi:hypothetical protein